VRKRKAGSKPKVAWKDNKEKCKSFCLGTKKIGKGKAVICYVREELDLEKFPKRKKQHRAQGGFIEGGEPMLEITVKKERENFPHDQEKRGGRGGEQAHSGNDHGNEQRRTDTKGKCKKGPRGNFICAKQHEKKSRAKGKRPMFQNTTWGGGEDR